VGIFTDLFICIAYPQINYLQRLFLFTIFLGISTSISASDFKSKLENNLNIGQINVTRVGACAGYNWTIEWATSGGNQPDIEVDGSSLTGNDVSVTSETVDDGGMFLRPIPGDMLRVAEPKPQVTQM
jgi:hypothetical protein